MPGVAECAWLFRPMTTTQRKMCPDNSGGPLILPPPRVEPHRGPPPHEKGPREFLDYDFPPADEKTMSKLLGLVRN